jgi:hypothetical protein
MNLKWRPNQDLVHDRSYLRSQAHPLSLSNFFRLPDVREEFRRIASCDWLKLRNDEKYHAELWLPGADAILWGVRCTSVVSRCGASIPLPTPILQSSPTAFK